MGGWIDEHTNNHAHKQRHQPNKQTSKLKVTNMQAHSQTNKVIQRQANSHTNEQNRRLNKQACYRSNHHSDHTDKKHASGDEGDEQNS